MESSLSTGHQHNTMKTSKQIIVAIFVMVASVLVLSGCDKAGSTGDPMKKNPEQVRKNKKGDD